MHFFHVIPLPRPRIGGAFVGVGVGGIDELVFSDPDPAEDAKHVRESPLHSVVECRSGQPTLRNLHVASAFNVWLRRADGLNQTPSNALFALSGHLVPAAVLEVNLAGVSTAVASFDLIHHRPCSAGQGRQRDD